MLTLKANVFELQDNKNIGKLFLKHEMFFLNEALFISDPSKILILQYPISTARLYHYLCKISPWPTETPLQRNPYYLLHQSPYFVLLNLTTRTSIGCQAICQAKPHKFFIKLYTDLWVRHATHQKARSLRIVSLSKSDNMVN